MRQSALVRDKWDRKDYPLERTILRALVKDGEFTTRSIVRVKPAR